MKPIRIKCSKIASWLGVGAIVIYPFVLFADENPSHATIFHEEVHLVQINRHGVIAFYWLYLWHYFKNRLKGMDHFTAYLQIPFEIEAFSKEAEFIERLKKEGLL